MTPPLLHHAQGHNPSGDEAIQSLPCHRRGALSLRPGISAVIARRRKPPKQSSHSPCHRPNARIAAPPFLDCFALASLGLAMTGKGVGLAMTVKGVRLAMTGKVRAGAQWREKSRAGAQ
jgi:hypothetical protein